MSDIQGVRNAGTRPTLARSRFAATTSGSHRSASHAGGCRIGTEGEQHQRDTGTARREEGVCLGVLREIRGTPIPSGIQNQLLAGTIRPEGTAHALLALLPGTRPGSLGKPGKRACLQRTRHDAAQRVGRPESVEHLQGSHPSTSSGVRQTTSPATRSAQPGPDPRPSRVVTQAQASPNGWRVALCVAVGCVMTGLQQAIAAPRWRTRHHAVERVSRRESVDYLQGSRQGASPRVREPAVKIKPGTNVPASSARKEAR